MNITFIHHSSYAIELEEHILLFDYVKGKLPKFSKEKKLYVFSSHVHYDHFDKIIFDIRKRNPNVTYILSEDIKRSLEENNDTFIEHQIQEHHDMIWMDEYQTKEIGQLKVQTLHSTDEGVAFMIWCEGQSIYYAGDLNWWYWKEEPKWWNDNMEDDFKKEINSIKGTSFDVAFLPLDNRLEQGAFLGVDYFMKHTDTKVVFPMHINGSLKIIDKIKKQDFATSYADKIIDLAGENTE
ncbi:MAG TPA: MBL fold metallo-hydrolase, partial [Candidatus Merdenecus merdavium]|nr:MBL fold metallo-hydrolase [Candidatus Merdenecus merdavium]